MERWEYCRLAMHGPARDGPLVRFYTPDGGMSHQVTDIVTTIYELGEDGWECVSHTAWVYGDEENEVMLFKRRKLS